MSRVVGGATVLEPSVAYKQTYKQKVEELRGREMKDTRERTSEKEDEERERGRADEEQRSRRRKRGCLSAAPP